MGTLVATMVLSYLVISADQHSSAPLTRHAVASVLTSSCLDDRYLAGEYWRLVTHMWVHGSVLHLVSNLATLLSLWALARHCFRGFEWLWLFLVSGIVAGPIQLLIEPARHPDFSTWTGSLASYFGQSHSPLVGASGGICGLWGALAAVAVRYCWSVPDAGHGTLVGRKFAFWLVVPFGLQVALDARSPGVAGFGHLAGWVTGFVLAALLPYFRPAYPEARQEA